MWAPSREVLDLVVIADADQLDPQIADAVHAVTGPGAHQILKPDLARARGVDRPPIAVEEVRKQQLECPALAGPVGTAPDDAPAGEGEFGVVVVPNVDDATAVQPPAAVIVLGRRLVDDLQPGGFYEQSRHRSSGSASKSETADAGGAAASRRRRARGRSAGCTTAGR